MSASDIALLDQWRARRDADAFAEIVSRHAGMVYGTCRRVLRDAAEAQDVAQDCFVELMQTSRPVRSSLPAWLHSIALHRSLDRVKAARRRRTREERYASERPDTTELDVDDVLEHVDEAVAELPDELRLPLIYRFLEGQTHDAIAKELDIAESTVRHRINRAVEQTRAALKCRGVQVGAAGMAALFADRLVEAAPPRLTSTLGKLAIAHAPGAAGLLGGWALAKLALAVGAVAVTAALGLYAAVDWSVPNPAGVTTPTSQPVQSSEPDRSATPTNEPTHLAAAPSESLANGSSNAPATASADEGGVIMGRVYDKDTGEGIEGVVLDVFPVGGGRHVAKSDPTDTEGNYRVTGLSDGSYGIKTRDLAAYPETRRGSSLTASVKQSQPATGIDFPLKRGIRVAGTVLSSAGVPLSGAEVAARTRHQANPARATSDEDGSFETFLSMPSDLLEVVASTDDFASEVLEFPLTEVGLEGIELRLTRSKTAEIAGIVVDPEGKPLAKVNVHLLPVSHRRMLRGGSVKTWPNGSFDFKQLLAGTYGLILTPAGVNGYVTDEVLMQVEVANSQSVKGLRLVFGEKGGSAIAGRVVDTAGKSVNGVRVMCSGPVQETVYSDDNGEFTVTGLTAGVYRLQTDHWDYTTAVNRAVRPGDTVELVLKGKATITGTVIRADTGEPFTEFDVSFTNAAPERFSQNLLSVFPQHVHNSNGEFTLENVYVMGSITVTAVALGYAPKFMVVEPVEHETISGLEFQLEPVNLFDGRVVTSTGEPVMGALVFAGRTQIYAAMEHRAVARSGADGTFQIDSLSPDIDFISAYHPDFAPGAANIRGETEIVLLEFGTLEGTVTLDGSPFAGGGVLVRYPEDERMPLMSGTADKGGMYQISGLAPGRVRVSSSISGHDRTVTAYGVIESGKTTVLDLACVTGSAVVEGYVTGVDLSEALVSIWITIDAGTGTFGVRCNADLDGSFRLDALPAGPADLEAKLYDKTGQKPVASVGVEFPLTDGETVRQDLDLSR